MNYSAINYVHYTIGMSKEMFVIGGKFAAGLSEPALAKLMCGEGEFIELYISSSNFEVLKGFVPAGSGTRCVVEKDTIVIAERYMRITFHRGIPASWTNQSGYRVMDPLPLKQWLSMNNYADWAKLMHDKPFEQRMEGWELTSAEAAFKERCAKHDWYSSYSDDHTVAKRGDEALTELKRLRDAIGGRAPAIYDHFASK